MNSESTSTTDCEIVLSRTLNAPREVVFKAFTDVEQVGQWWGPNGFTTTTHEMDVRPGGKWDFIMHGPDGTDYPNLVTYREVSPPERLVYDHGEPGAEPEFVATITFDEVDGKTKVTMHSVFPSKEVLDYLIREVHAIEGGNQTLDRLVEFLKA